MYDQIFGTSISSNAVASGTVAAMALINLIFPKEKYEM